MTTTTTPLSRIAISVTHGGAVHVFEVDLEQALYLDDGSPAVTELARADGLQLAIGAPRALCAGPPGWRTILQDDRKPHEDVPVASYRILVPPGESGEVEAAEGDEP